MTETGHCELFCQVVVYIYFKEELIQSYGQNQMMAGAHHTLVYTSTSYQGS